jgi:hypothetical protein
LILGRAHLHAATAAIEPQELIGVRMCFESDVAAHRNRHQCDLQIPAAPGHGAVVLVLERLVFKIERLWLRADVLDCQSISPRCVECATVPHACFSGAISGDRNQRVVCGRSL